MDVQLFESIYKPRAGGTTTKAVSRTISNTGLSQTEVLLREAIQNSYDAHLVDDNKPLKLGLKCYKFSKDSVEFISNLFKEAGKIGQSLEKKILSGYYNLEILDRNTTGLTGYNGFQEHESDTEEKFHHFIYMTGNDDVKDKGSGGSYGFGKAALYKYSDFRIIVVYSRIYSINSNQYQSRFIICRIDDRLPEKESRCWWGSEGKYSDGTTYAKPINGQEADFLAKKFGMTPFSETETGTDILIMKTIVKEGSQSFESTFKEEIPALICHWFWPKIITHNLQKKIEFKLFLNGEDITKEIPNPTDTYPYSTFSRAFRNCVDYYSHKAGSNNDVVLVNFERPYVELGGIFLKKVGIRPFMYGKYISTDFSKPQVALMRDVEFIVKYEEIDVDVSNTHMTCFGLFHTNRLGHRQNGDDSQEVEHYFRDIENQTHNQWTHSDILPFNYLGKVNKILPESVKKCLDIKTSIGNAASISGLVAQKFGSKLGFGFIGGASDAVQDDTLKTGKIKKKSSFTRKNVPVELSVENNSTILTVSYEAKIENGIPLSVNLITVIKSSDPKESEIALENEIKIKYLSFTDRSGTTSMTPPKQPGNLFKIQKSGDYKLILESNIDCAFDIQMKKVEING